MIDRAEQLRQREEALHTPKDRGRQTDAQWIALHKRAAELAAAVLAHPAELLAARIAGMMDAAYACRAMGDVQTASMSKSWRNGCTECAAMIGDLANELKERGE